jgi:hypothetical protein
MRINQRLSGVVALPLAAPQERPGRWVMRRLLDRIDALMAAVAFAEEGEVEMARRLVAAWPARKAASRP